MDLIPAPNNLEREYFTREVCCFSYVGVEELHKAVNTRQWCKEGLGTHPTLITNETG